MNNMRNKILSLLVLLLTAATGAWAETFTTFQEGDIIKVGDKIHVDYWMVNNLYYLTPTDTYTLVRANIDDQNNITEAADGAYYVLLFEIAGTPFYKDFGKSFLATANSEGLEVTAVDTSADPKTLTLAVFGDPAEPALTVEWNASTKTGTFSMPGSDVVLTPIYSKATIYEADGVTEKGAYASLQEAFGAVQEGNVIKLDDDVTLTEQLQTPITNDGVMFTLDFNGYILDGSALMGNAIRLNNSGDRMIFLDSTEGEMGGLKGTVVGLDNALPIFVSGRYSMYLSAETLNKYCLNSDIYGMALADGKEFIELEGGADANDGFTVRVAYKDFELTIGAGRFATFYDDKNITVAEGENISFYTISLVNNARTEAVASIINSSVIPAGTPILVYNGGDQKQNVKLKETTEAVNLNLNIAPEFKGTLTDRDFTADDMTAADYYTLSGGKLFVPVYEAGTIAANKCWLQFDHQQTPGARNITIMFEDATGINSMVNGQWSMDTWYDLQGRRVTKPTKGVFIRNGRKVVVK